MRERSPAETLHVVRSSLKRCVQSSSKIQATLHASGNLSPRIGESMPASISALSMSKVGSKAHCNVLGWVGLGWVGLGRVGLGKVG